ncbi:MAG TPA: glycoside hydrolase family 16 protein [Candidatus Sulfotelmatobacter sp.]|jgi:hypothetical protein
MKHPQKPAALLVLTFTLVLSGYSAAQTQIVWQGHTWNVTNGPMAGVAPGSPSNVTIDSNGYLHLNITNNAGKWTAGELFMVDNLGFGTYQWVVQGNVWSMDPVTVLGLFPYGPANGIGVDGTNEIDIEFSQWDNTCSCNADFTVYPSTGHHHSKSSYNLNFTVSNGTTLTTARMQWSSTSVVFTLMSGNQPIGTTANVLKTATYTSTNTANIPQQPIPVGMNLWAYKTVPATNQSVIIQSFQYMP